MLTLLYQVKIIARIGKTICRLCVQSRRLRIHQGKAFQQFWFWTLPVKGNEWSNGCLQENRDSQLPELIKGSYVILQSFNLSNLQAGQFKRWLSSTKRSQILAPQLLQLRFKNCSGDWEMPLYRCRSRLYEVYFLDFGLTWEGNLASSDNKIEKE